MRRNHQLSTSLLAGCAALGLLIPGLASAQTQHSDVFNLLIRDGENAGEVDRRANGRENPEDQIGAGAEHCDAVQLASGNIMIFCLSSYNGIPGDVQGDGVLEFDGINPEPGQEYAVPDTHQGLCTEIAMNPLTGPEVVTQRFITDLDGNRDRNFNKPNVSATADGKYAIAEFNYAPNADLNQGGRTCNANHACRFARVIGPGCVAMSNPRNGGYGTLLQTHNNDNSCDVDSSAVQTEVSVVGDTSVTNQVATCGANGNGEDDAWVYGSKTVCDPADPDGDGYECNISFEFEVSVHQDHERDRGECFYSATLSAERGSCSVMCVGTAGNTQPPNRGTRGVVVDCSDTDFPVDAARGELGRLVTQQEGNRYNGAYIGKNYNDENGERVYHTEIRCSQLASDDSVLVCNHQVGNGEGRRNGPGYWTNTALSAKFNSNGTVDVQSLGKAVAPTVDVSHGQTIGLMWGTSGAEEFRHIGIYGSINGSSNSPAEAVVFKYDATTRNVVEEALYSLGASIDTAWISNIYGNNPNTQGRNFVNAVQVANPGYGVAGGFYTDVKSFLAIPATTRRLRSEIAPGMDYRINEDKLAMELVLLPAVIDAPADPADPNDDVDSDGDGIPDGQDDDGNGGPGSSGGTEGGCTVSSGSSTGMGSLFALAFALVFVMRRRRSGSVN